ncbi:Arc family DNA-binding protein [Dyella marensis]|uniref:Arc family DNA-binding protein n=1 Tax=Dyella marensis TaxID=500610 RepID=UPI0031D4AA73
MADETSLTQFKLRLPALLKERLEIAAAENARSITAEIVQRLEDSFPSIETALMHNRREELRRLEMEIAMTRERVMYLRSRLVTITGDRDPTAAVQLRELEEQLEVFQMLENESARALALLEKRLQSKKTHSA